MSVESVEMEHWPVCLSYFDPFDVFGAVQSEFSSIFPLDVVRWKTNDGSVRTIENLPVKLTVEDDQQQSNIKFEEPYIRLIVVTCISVDEYRTKVRPLLHQWLPTVHDSSGPFTMPLILLYANSEVTDTSIFKTMSVMDKLNKDFPDVQALELKSVYKSPAEKTEFWLKLSNKLKAFLIEVFQHRIRILESKLTRQFTENEELEIREQLFKIYAEFRRTEDAKGQLSMIKNLMDKRIKNVETGKLEVPFEMSLSGKESTKQLLSAKNLTKFTLYRSNFLRELMLLQLYDDDISKYTQIYELTKDFIRKIEKEFSADTRLLEFKFDFCKKMLDTIPSTSRSEWLPTINEIKADIYLIKRDAWINGLMINHGYQLLQKNYSNKTPYSFGLDKEAAESEDAFQKSFALQTKELLALYSQCNGKRQRMADILSLEVGLLHYQRKEYTKAVQLLMSCNEYYTESKWTVIGVNILEIFVDSLTNCVGIETIDFDGESVPVSTILRNSYLNLIKYYNSTSEKKIFWNKFLELKNDDMTELVYPSEGLIDFSVDGNVFLHAPNVYGINVEIKGNGFPDVIDVTQFKITMKNSNNEFNEFIERDFLLEMESKSYCLKSKNITFGEFGIESIELCIGSTTIIKAFEDTTNKVIIEPLFHESNVWFEIRESNELKLGKYELEIADFNFGHTNDLELYLEVGKSEVTQINPVSFDSEIDQATITLDKESLSESKKIKYFFNEQQEQFTLFAKLTYSLQKNPDVIYSISRVIHIDHYLPLSVSVEDIFKKDKFFFKFLLNSSVKEEPVLIFGSELQCFELEHSYELSGPFIPDSPLTITGTGGESCINCFQISTKQTFNNSDIFHLMIKYCTLRDFLKSYVTDAVLLEGDVEFFQKYETWKLYWLSNILSELEFDYNLYEKNMILKLNGHSLDIFKVGVRLKYMKVDPVVRSKFLSCLKRLSEGIDLTEMEINEYMKVFNVKTLTVPVQLPELERFYEVSFARQDCKRHQTPSKVGEPLAFHIKIKNSSDKWGIQPHDKLAYTFEIINNNDWLVHGRKRMILKDDFEEMDIDLIPLRKGYLTLPQIEITSSVGNPVRVDNSNTYDIVLVF